MLESWALQNAKWKKRIAALLYENQHLHGAACLRALCGAEAQSIRAYGLHNPICIIPNGVDLPDLSETPTLQAQAFAEGRRILLYLGRLHPKKNVANLIRAWKQILNSHPSARASWVLAIAGWSQDRYEQKLKHLAGNLDRAATPELASIAFLGPRFGMEKNECYRACSAFIMPSLSEGLPMTVLEAWAYAKPVLMTPECNLSEGFAAGAALQIGTSPEEIAAGLKQVIEMSDDDRRAMGNRGRNLVATKFLWPRIGEQMRSVYGWALGGGAVPESVRL
jgi:poly(glycerol-phosphate) alpha-glucosyltransferase